MATCRAERAHGNVEESKIRRSEGEEQPSVEQTSWPDGGLRPPLKRGGDPEKQTPHVHSWCLFFRIVTSLNCAQRSPASAEQSFRASISQALSRLAPLRQPDSREHPSPRVSRDGREQLRIFGSST
jgi:hypothetical protein